MTLTCSFKITNSSPFKRHDIGDHRTIAQCDIIYDIITDLMEMHNELYSFHLSTLLSIVKNNRIL